MSASTSDERAPGSVTMKFECLRRHGCAAHAKALASRRLDQASRMVALGVGEDAPAVRLGERLGTAAPFPCLVHAGADLGWLRRLQPDDGTRHDRVGGRGRSAGTRTPRPAPGPSPPVRPAGGTSRSARAPRTSCPRVLRRSCEPPRPAWPGSRRRTPNRRDRGAARRRRARAAGSRLPRSGRSPSRATHRYPRPRRRTNPGNPASDTKMFEPLPITTNGTSVATIASPAAARSASDSGSR